MSLSLISSSDFLPKLRYLSMSDSCFWQSSPTVVMFALLRQLAERTESSISLTESESLARRSSDEAATASTSPSSATRSLL